MNKSIYALKILLLLLVLVGLSCKTFAQETDVWSGDYLLKSSKAVVLDSMQIKKADDARPEDLASKYHTDLNRWMLISKSQDTIKARRFLYNIEKKQNEYEQFGWTDLYVKGNMKCLDAKHFFICQTRPNTKVTLSDEESFFTETGLFGIRLHYGLFNLEKLD